MLNRNGSRQQTDDLEITSYLIKFTDANIRSWLLEIPYCIKRFATSGFMD